MGTVAAPAAHLIERQCVPCRPATADFLDDDQQPIGVPSTLSLLHSSLTDSMFFVVVCPANRTASRKQLPFQNLKLNCLLGKGTVLSKWCSQILALKTVAERRQRLLGWCRPCILRFFRVDRCL